MSVPSSSLAAWFDACDLPTLLNQPEVRGAGIRVGLIDTGVDVSSLPHPIAEQLRFVPEQLQPLPVATSPPSPHGTTVADILLEIAPEVSLFSADVFGARGTCEVEVLMRALRYALDVWKCHVINLSLGIAESQLVQVPRRLALLRLVEEAYFRNVVVVAAAGNDHPLSKSYPAAFGSSVIGVARHEGTDPRDIRYLPHERIEFQATGKARHGPLASVPTTSWATPHVSGVVAQLLGMCPALTPFEVKTLLVRLSARRR